MAQSDKMFLSTVYCWRERDSRLTKAHFFSFQGNDEKQLYSIDTNVVGTGDDLSREFKFIGSGKLAVLPETRLRIDVDEFFAGKISGYAMRKPEMSLRMNIVNAQKGDKAVRLCNVQVTLL